MRVFLTKDLENSLTEEQRRTLANDFKHYQSGHSIPEYFGRDVPYDNDQTLPIIREEDVRHLHLIASNNLHSQQGQLQHYRTSDAHLVYCQGAKNPCHYLLIAILRPDAHAQARDNNLMYAIAKQAESFRQKH